ncbi:hypothetical protein EJB05_10054 [Eragrostis curvula]|uniref:Uncharacterized protein n=1 Tax=Eragrostis curvula TaxID=38414 RepID=A0A5J9W803_9POAL|nr:hypothetical protein EJB05_10054 [Eragrostis curvula]
MALRLLVCQCLSLDGLMRPRQGSSRRQGALDGLMPVQGRLGGDKVVRVLLVDSRIQVHCYYLKN